MVFTGREFINNVSDLKFPYANVHRDGECCVRHAVTVNCPAKLFEQTRLYRRYIALKNRPC